MLSAHDAIQRLQAGNARFVSGQWSREAIDEPRRFGEFASADWVSHYLNSGRRAVTSAYASD